MILASALPALALANPATMPRAASQEPRGIIDILLGNFRLPDVPWEQIGALQTCFQEHDSFEPDFTKANDGVFSISNVDPSCCEIAKDLWSQLPAGKYGEVSFTDTCDAATGTGISALHMAYIASFLSSL